MKAWAELNNYWHSCWPALAVRSNPLCWLKGSTVREEKGQRTNIMLLFWSHCSLSVTVQECPYELNEDPQEVSPLAVDVTAGQRPSIWNTGLFGNTALCRHNNYDGHLRAETHYAAADFANKVMGIQRPQWKPLESKICLYSRMHNTAQ